MDKPTRPLALEIEDAKKELSAFIEQLSAKHGLPCYLLELLMSDVLGKLQNGKHVELENAQRSYEQKLEEYKIAKEEKDV